VDAAIAYVHAHHLHVGVDAGGDAAAGGALPAGRLWPLTVEGLSQLEGQGAFAHLGRPHEEIGVGLPALGQAALKGGHRPVLSDRLPHGIA
jgi:hypothetical protein